MILLSFGLIMGCRSTKSISHVQQNNRKIDSSKQVFLQLGELKAHDIQENLTGHDELFLTFSVAKISNDSIVFAHYGSSMLGPVKKGSSLNLSTIPALKITLERGQILGIQVSLWEIDDYQKIQNALKSFHQVGGFLQIPVSLFEWSSVSNPLGWFLWATRVGGWGLDWLSKVDNNDLLGTSEIKWNWQDLPLGSSTRFKKVPWKGGKKGINDYYYEISYQIKIKDISK